MFPLTLDTYFEIAALLVSILCYSSIRDKSFKWFIPFLFMIVLVELAGRYIRTQMMLTNSWLYNISIPVEYFFYTYLFYKNYQLPVLKKMAKGLLFIIPVASAFNTIFIQGFWNFDTNILMAGSCIMIFLCCCYLVDLLKREEEVILLREPMFWITTGLLFFNLGELSYNMFFQYIITHKQDQKAVLFTAINSKLIYVLYTFISIALVCTTNRVSKR